MNRMAQYSHVSRATSVASSSTRRDILASESPTVTISIDDETKFDETKRTYAKSDLEKAELSIASVTDAEVAEVADDGVDEKSPRSSSGGGGSGRDKDGGLEGWLTVLGAFLVQFTGFGYCNAFGVYQDFYVREYLTSYTSSQISWIGSTQVFILMSAGILTGRLFDKGYFYHLIIVGSAILIFGLFMLSLAKPQQYYQIFLTQALLAGIGSGISYIPSIGVIAHHFRSPAKRALTMGIVASGSSLGGLLHPIMLNNLFHKGANESNNGAGFAGGVRASAGLVAGLQVIAVLLMRARYDRVKTNTKLLGLRTSVMKFSGDVAYISLSCGMFLFAQGLFFPIFYVQLNAIDHGLDPTFAFYSLSILNGMSLIGRIIPGFFARQLGVINMLIFCGISCSILIFSMLGVKDVPGVSVFAALYGFFSGAYVTLLAPMLALLADHPSEIGARMGVCFFFVGVGGLIGSPINGALLSTTFTWWRPIVYSGVVSVTGSAMFTACKVLVMRRKAIVELQAS